MFFNIRATTFFHQAASFAALTDLYGSGYVPVYMEKSGVISTLGKEVHDISSCALALVTNLADMLAAGRIRIALYT